MPELPEVETIRRGLAPHLTGCSVVRMVVRERRLRWPVPAELEAALAGTVIERVERRAKYLLFHTARGCMLLHLGMSGRVRLLAAPTPPGRHDHVDVELAGGACLRLTDPRRFGALLWTEAPPEQHPLLRNLGPEPFSEAFDAGHLHGLARGRRAPVKTFIMDGRIVVGVGNIYASEALFQAGISPTRAAGRIAERRYGALVEAIRRVLEEAIRQGGTTLRDFSDGDGAPGWFQQQLCVYGRQRLPCLSCGGPIQRLRLGQRATYYCPRCQS